jgi:hypothetical protein
VALFMLETVSINCLARIELRLLDKAGEEEKKSLTAEMALASAFESADKALCIFEIRCDHLDALG